MTPAYSVARRSSPAFTSLKIGSQQAEARTAFTWVGWGVGLGLVAALASASLIGSQLFGVSDVDPVRWRALLRS